MVWAHLAAAGCGPSSDENAGANTKSKSMFRTVQFQPSSKAETKYGEAAFQQDAKTAFRNVFQKDITVQNSTLLGVVEEGEGGDELLLLSVHMEVAQTAVPLETTLQASFGKGRAIDEAVRLGLADAARAVREMLHLVHASKSRLTEALSSPELDIQLFAAALIGEKKIASAAEPLCRMLNDPREEAAEAAAEALKKVATPASVPLIIQSIAKKNLRSEVRAMEVIAAVGGSEAEAYLEMTAMGHEVPEVRALSETLLKMMRSKDAR
jgi:hypothetical protein